MDIMHPATRHVVPISARLRGTDIHPCVVISVGWGPATRSCVVQEAVILPVMKMAERPRGARTIALLAPRL